MNAVYYYERPVMPTRHLHNHRCCGLIWRTILLSAEGISVNILPRVISCATAGIQTTGAALAIDHAASEQLTTQNGHQQFTLK